MARMKVGIVSVGAIIVLLGLVAAVTMRGDSGPNRAATVTSQAPSETPASVVPGTGMTLPAQPTAQDVQKVLAGIMASMVPAAGTTATTAPLTREQVEAQLREQLRLIGVTY